MVAAVCVCVCVCVCVLASRGIRGVLRMALRMALRWLVWGGVQAAHVKPEQVGDRAQSEVCLEGSRADEGRD